MRIIGGIYKNRTLKTPRADITRPTSGRLREALFNICQHYIDDASFLDLFAGSGAMGIEALSRGAKSATFIDSARDCIKCIESNIENLQAQKAATIIYGDVFETLKKLMSKGKQFDIIYADPPYDMYDLRDGKEISYSTLVVKIVDEGSLLKPEGSLFIEDSGEASPQLESELKTLKLESSRKLGRSVLLEYRR